MVRSSPRALRCNGGGRSVILHRGHLVTLPAFEELWVKVSPSLPRGVANSDVLREPIRTEATQLAVASFVIRWSYAGAGGMSPSYRVEGLGFRPPGEKVPGSLMVEWAFTGFTDVFMCQSSILTNGRYGKCGPQR